MRMAGVDGCKAGWVVAVREANSHDLTVKVVDRFVEVLAEPLDIICIDVPIGLMDEAQPGGRVCDVEARKLLGQPRARSVFSPPVRPALAAGTFEEAVRLNRTSSSHRIGISQQTFGILRKIREVDELMTPELQERVIEVHPELVFYELNGAQPVTARKKSKDGREQRVRLLSAAFGDVSELVEHHRTSQVGRDDIIDAIAACWTAERVLRGCEVRIPREPQRDSKGLRMEIVR